MGFSNTFKVTFSESQQSFDAKFSQSNESFETAFADVLIAPTLDHSRLRNRDLDDQHPIKAITGLQSILNTKVDKEPGKGLSTNDFDDVYKTMLETINSDYVVHAVLDDYVAKVESPGYDDILTQASYLNNADILTAFNRVFN